MNKINTITPINREEFQKVPSVWPVELVDENNDEKLPLLLEAEGTDDIELPIELAVGETDVVAPIDDVADDAADDAAEAVFDAIFLAESPTEEIVELILLDAVSIAELIWTLYKFY